jgi:UDP-GlcNAc:undecaprenyl-phosphate GlcNAc-1-phosphate transferase
MIELIIISIAINSIFFLLYNKISEIFSLYDLPDYNRKIHLLKIPNIGGFIFAINALIFLFYSCSFQDFFNDDFVIFIYLFSLIFFIIGFCDDKNYLKPVFKLFLSGVLVYVAIFFNDDFVIKNIKIHSLSIDLNLGKYSIFFTILCMLLFLNALNMFDGINLQLGLYLLTVFLIFIYKDLYQSFSFLMIISILFFLYFNFKNKIFLGNAGVWFCAYFIGAATIDSYNQKNINVELILMFLIFPGIDMLRVFIERIFKKKHPFYPDKIHIHHILLDTLDSFKTIIIIFLCYFLPILFFLITEKFIFSFFLLLFLYFFIYVKFKFLKSN